MMVLYYLTLKLRKMFILHSVQTHKQNACITSEVTDKMYNLPLHLPSS